MYSNGVEGKERYFWGLKPAETKRLDSKRIGINYNRKKVLKNN